MPTEPTPIWYRYTFTFDDGVKKLFEVRLDSQTLEVLPPQGAVTAPPEWTRLEHSQCENCPLDPLKKARCPIAVNMVKVVEGFQDIISYKTADVLVESVERSVFKRVPVQNALYSLIGIYMSASGCPIMDKLKPLVRFHLPFASVDETVYRMTTMYVMAQFLRMKEGLTPDWELAHVSLLFDAVHKVNVGFCQRLKGAIEQDSVVNSVSILDVFANMGKSPTPKRMAAMRVLFAPYLEDKTQA